MHTCKIFSATVHPQGGYNLESIYEQMTFQETEYVKNISLWTYCGRYNTSVSDMYDKCTQVCATMHVSVCRGSFCLIWHSTCSRMIVARHCLQANHKKDRHTGLVFVITVIVIVVFVAVVIIVVRSSSDSRVINITNMT